ncbi:HET-domain-containing protein, partial [Acephala macrosclerotiorum]
MEAIDAATATNRPHYEPLREKDSIRLLILYPGLPDDEISCSLLHVRFCESPRYEALSYMWGSEKDQMEILLDGNKHPIRNNLWQALKHLRSERYKRFLWADALCIDQASEEERNHQVAQMSDIYEQAMGVRVWLGLEDE